jgi:hypothetical protein
LGEDHKLMVSFSNFNLEILFLPLLAHIYTPHTQSSPNTATKNTWKTNTLR